MQFLRLVVDIVKERAEECDGFLSRHLPVTGYEQRVFIPRGESFQRLPPAGNRCLFIEANRVEAIEEQIAGIDHILFRYAHQDICSGMARVVLNAGGQSTEIQFHWQPCRIERVIGKGQYRGVHEVEDAAYCAKKAFAAFPGGLVFGFLQGLFKRRQSGILFQPLQGGVTAYDTFGCGSVRPQGDALRAIKRITHRVIVVIVGFQCGFHRRLRDAAHGFKLKSRTARGGEAFKKQYSVFANEKSAIAGGLKPLRRVRNGCVQPLPDLSHGSESLVRNYRLGHARIVRKFRSQCAQRHPFASGKQRPEIGRAREKVPAGKSTGTGSLRCRI